MSKNRVLSVVCGLAAALAGCGGTNNDQGVAFSHLGYYGAVEDDFTCDNLPNGLLGVVVPLGAISRGDPITNPDLASDANDFGDGSVAGVVGFRNNLNGQAMNVRRVLISYFIPGATEQPPSTTVPLNGVLGPADQGTDGFDSSLPQAFAGTEQCALASTTLVPPSVFRWILFNQDKLPSTPFNMEVTTVIVATATGGNTYESNPQTLFVTFTPETAVAPPDAAGSATGAATSEGDESSDSVEGSTSEDTLGVDTTVPETSSGDDLESTPVGSDL